MSPNFANFNPESKLTFHATPYEGGVVPFAVLGFCWIEDRIVLANIKNRGWCVPSGRIEQGESPVEAIAREAEEECGITGTEWLLFGWFEVNESNLCRVSLAYTTNNAIWEGNPRGDDSVGSDAFTIERVREIYYDWNSVMEQAINASKITANRLR